MHADIGKLQARAARHPSKHVQRFVPLIKIAIEAIESYGVSCEQRYENQIKIAGRWIGRYEHPPRNFEHVSRLAIYDSLTCYGEPIIVIRNEAEAKLFAATLAFAREL
jgi:hypothetical protein